MNAKKQRTPPRQIVSSAVLADWLAMSTRRARELAAAGVFVKVGRGKFDLKASVQRHAEHTRESAAGRSADVSSANLKIKEATAKLAQLRYDREAGLLIEVDLVRRTWSPLMRGVRNLMLGWAAKAAFLIPAATAADRAALYQMTCDDLEDAALARGFDFSGTATASDVTGG
jgi:hypothetical protein